MLNPTDKLFSCLREPRSMRGNPAAFALVGLILAGCSNVDRTVATSAIPDDYHQRHPIALVNARTKLDIFLIGQNSRFDYRQKHDIEAFAADFLAHGEGLVRVQVPRGSVSSRAVDTTLTAVRHQLAASGVKGEIEVGSYQVTDERLASVLRMSFVKLEAKTATRCGDWPEDLGHGTSLDGWENRTYYNFGCASQQTLAAQIDDPRDLIRPRAEDPSDVQMRTRAIEDIRGIDGAPIGIDPSTRWNSTLPLIGSVGSP